MWVSLFEGFWCFIGVVEEVVFLVGILFWVYKLVIWSFCWTIHKKEWGFLQLVSVHKLRKVWFFFFVRISLCSLKAVKGVRVGKVEVFMWFCLWLEKMQDRKLKQLHTNNFHPSVFFFFFLTLNSQMQSHRRIIRFFPSFFLMKCLLKKKKLYSAFSSFVVLSISSWGLLWCYILLK